MHVCYAWVGKRSCSQLWHSPGVPNVTKVHLRMFRDQLWWVSQRQVMEILPESLSRLIKDVLIMWKGSHPKCAMPIDHKWLGKVLIIFYNYALKIWKSENVKQTVTRYVHTIFKLWTERVFQTKNKRSY